MRRFRKPILRTRAQADPVTPVVRAIVMDRDGGCVAAKMEPGHVCRDMWGTPHSPRALARLTLEHVKDELRAGKRAPSDPEHLVTLCYGANVGVPSKELRAALRSYLRTVDEHHHVEPVPGCAACYQAFG